MQANSPKAKHRGRLVVGVSGSGRSLENFLTCQDKFAAYTVVGVISSSPHCRAAAIARDYGLPLYTEVFSGSCEPSPELVAWLSKLEVEWIALAGFLKIFPTAFPPTALWREGIVNIHPSLLPDFAGKNMYGLRVHAAAIAASVSESGASIHFVNARYDEGRVIAQIKVPVLPEDSAEELADRVFQAECLLYPYTIAALINGDLPLRNGSIYNHQQESASAASCLPQGIDYANPNPPNDKHHP